MPPKNIYSDDEQKPSPTKKDGCTLFLIIFSIIFIFVLIYTGNAWASFLLSFLIAFFAAAMPSSYNFDKDLRRRENEELADMISKKQKEQETNTNAALEEEVKNLREELDSIRKKLDSNNEQ